MRNMEEQEEVALKTLAEARLGAERAAEKSEQKIVVKFWLKSSRLGG